MGIYCRDLTNNYCISLNHWILFNFKIQLNDRLFVPSFRFGLSVNVLFIPAPQDRDLIRWQINL